MSTTILENYREQISANERSCAAANFDVYGFRFTVKTNSYEALEGIRQDFAFFHNPDAVDGITVELLDEDPPRSGLPTSDATVYTPRNVVYREGSRRFIDYHGKALGIQDQRTRNLKLYSHDANLLYEATYLYLLAQIGEYLDEQGIHRIHALGIKIKDKAVLVLLPMGGGKSTLGLHLLEHPEVTILSDDSPLIDRTGKILAYPLRLGLLPGSENSIPPEHRRVIQRMEFGAKHLVNYSYFESRVSKSADAGVVLLGARTLAPGCTIEEMSWFAGLRACISNCVVGVGLFQGLEFVLQTSAWELVKKAGVGISRLRSCSKLLRRSRVSKVHLGPDPAFNAQTVVNYVMGLKD